MTIKVNREIILKDLLNKVKEAKRLNMKEVKLSIKELDDLAYVVYQLMAEDISKIFDLKDKKENPEPEPIKKKTERKVLEEIPKEDKEDTEPPPEMNLIINEPPKTEEIEPPAQEPEVEEEEVEFNVDNALFGGTW